MKLSVVKMFYRDGTLIKLRPANGGWVCPECFPDTTYSSLPALVAAVQEFIENHS